MKPKFFILVLLLLVTILAGCQPDAALTTDAPASETLAAYLNALTAKDETTLSALSCADWESQALLELDAFQAVDTSLEDLACRQTTTEDGSVTVNCSGKIVASYGNEVQEFDLSRRTYHMLQDNGDWLVCGYDS